MRKLLIFVLILAATSTSVIADDRDVYEGISNFTKVLDLIERNYVDEVDSKKLTTDAIQGMLRNLDPYSIYLSKEEFRELEIDTYGEFGGIGVELTVKDGFMTVITPIVDSPAYDAGIKPGDRIVSIEGQSTENMNTYDAAKLLRGKRGAQVKITIEQADSGKNRELVLEREIIRIKSVKRELLDNGVGYIKLLQFQKKSADEFADAYTELSQSNEEDELRGLIVDLRNNPGGLLDQAIEVADHFIDNGVIVSVKGRSVDETKDYHGTSDRLIPDIPVVVLINRGSASASEVLAGALRDHGIAVLVGSGSFGKGSVQTIVELEDGSGIKLTTARFYTPGGDKINDVGITPDVIVPGNGQKDLQLQKALEVLSSGM